MSKFNPQLHDKAVLVQLNCAFSWGTITDKAITRETNDNKGAIQGAMHVRKSLLPAASGTYVKLVQSTLAQFYQFHLSRTFSSSTDGQRLMPTAFHFEYEEKFGETQASTHAAMQALEANYPDAVKQAKTLLGTSFNPADYPDVDDIWRYYKFKRRFLPVPSGNAIMNAMGASVAAEVDGYVEDILKSAASDAKDRLKAAVARVQEQCSNPKGKIYDSLTGSIDELLGSLPALVGLTADDELQELLKVVRQNLGGFDAKDIRESQGTRSEAAKAAAAIMKRMTGVK